MSGRIDSKIFLTIFFFLGLLVIQAKCQEEKPQNLFKILKLPQRIIQKEASKIQLSEESSSSSSTTTSAVPETEATTKFSFPPIHGDNTTTATTTTPKGNNSTSFTWPPLHKDNSTTTQTSPTPHNTTFTWPPLHTTSAPFTWKQDLIPIIVGASLGGLVVIVLAGYFIARMRNNSQADDRERLVNN